jgi:hypothetical protein
MRRAGSVQTTAGPVTVPFAGMLDQSVARPCHQVVGQPDRDHSPCRASNEKIRPVASTSDRNSGAADDPVYGVAVGIEIDMTNGTEI